MTTLAATTLMGYEYAEHDSDGTIQIDCAQCRRLLDPSPRDFPDEVTRRLWRPTVPASEEWGYCTEVKLGQSVRKIVRWILAHERAAEEKGWHKRAQEEGTRG